MNDSGVVAGAACGSDPGMLSAYLRALGQIGEPRIVGLCIKAAALAVLVFALLWAAVWWTLDHTTVTELGWLDTVVDWLGILATPLLAWFLFPTAFSATLSLFLEAVARAVEQRHYRDLPPAPGLPFWTALLASLRFLVVLLLANLLLLPLLLLPVLFPAAYYLANGYLIGREYFELVALRRLDPPRAAALRRQHGFETLLFGIATAVLLTVPFVNLVVPVVGTMAMVHLIERWRRRQADGAGGVGAA